MIEVTTKQGSDEWLGYRRGIPTSSQFKRICTRTGKLSESRGEYMAELLAEYFCNEDGAELQGFAGNKWTEYGLAMEPRALAAYGFDRDMDGRRGGVCFRDESRMIAASPDWMIDPDGLAEVKCPMAGTHLYYLALGRLPGEYFCQVQGQLWVTGRDWCDFVSYAPNLPMFIVRAEPDPDYQAALDKHLPQFVDELIEARRRLLDMGVVDPWREPTEADAEKEQADARQWAEAVGLL